MRIEFDVAQMYGKKRCVVWLDEINPYEHSDDVHDDLKVWYWNVARLQGIRMAGKSVEQIAWSMVTEFHLIKGNHPQPPSPVFQPTAKKPESEPKPQPIRQTQPMQEPKPKPVLQPQPVVSDKPVTPILKDSNPQPTTSSAKPATVKHTPIIVTIAVVLVVAMVGGIWLASALSDNSTSKVKSLSELDSISKGDHFTFGNYPQGSNGEVKPIEWRVLAVEDGKALVISEKLLDCVQCNKANFSSITWETCTLRQWMNNDFLNQAFSSSEQAKIVFVTNHNIANTSFIDNSTQDRIFALSLQEMIRYFENNDDRLAVPTEYAKKQGSCIDGTFSHSSGESPGWWWLRTLAHNDLYSYYAVGVTSKGAIYKNGFAYNSDDIAVRPAFWLNLD